MITNKKIIDESDYKYVLTSTSTDENTVNVEIHCFNSETIKFSIPSADYDKLDEMVLNRLILKLRRKKLNKIKKKI